MKVAVIGGGIIGLAGAWRCVQRGHSVTVYDPDPGKGASNVAAGMLAPVSEAYFGEGELTRLLLEAARRWVGFAEELGGDLGYDSHGTLQVGLTADDHAQLARLWRLQESLGETVEKVDVKELEPVLSPRARGVRVGADHQVDPRRVVARLLELVPVVRERVTEVPGADVTVLATGAQALGVPVRPVKGVVLRLRGPVGLRHVIRGYADGQSVYVVPRSSGEVVVGASSEESSDLTAPVWAVRDLLKAATDLVPDLAEHALIETNVGHRPATPDNGPIVGELRPGLLAAAGHYRHGVLAAPLTADAVADYVDGKGLAEIWKPFAPGRFA